jgi:hypothetical protein
MPHRYLMSCYLSPLKNISKNLRNMPHHLSQLIFFQENHLMPYHISPLKKDSENSSSMLRHLSLFKNNSKNSTKSTHATSPFSIEK